MKSQMIELDGKKIILLTGARPDKATGKKIEVEALDKLVSAVKRDPDAVAFGYTAHRWVAAA
ncbi:MAG: hypothetical protein ABL901_16840 [Hyphomicrobiaceae bacterium]